MRQNQQNDLCPQWRLRSAWASVFTVHIKKHWSLATHWVHNGMPRLIWVFAGPTSVGFVILQLINTSTAVNMNKFQALKSVAWRKYMQEEVFFKTVKRNKFYSLSYTIAKTFDIHLTFIILRLQNSMQKHEEKIPSNCEIKYTACPHINMPFVVPASLGNLSADPGLFFSSSVWPLGM